MAKSLGKTWDLMPHSAAKHEILRRYLQAWIPILSSTHRRIMYIDGFAGPGEYRGGEPGSPVIALQAAIDHADRITGEMSFLFIEEDEERKANLERCVEKLCIPANFHLDIRSGRCNETVSALLDGLEQDGRALVPTFAFLDPFGFAHTPLDLIARLMRRASCEVLVTFMYDEINRFLNQKQQPANFDALFGTTEWRKGLEISDRRQYLRDLYRTQLEQRAQIRYVRAFEMFNRRNQTDYFLFFGTNRIEGLKKMKDAMWKVDQTGAFSFSDATDPRQTVLFDRGPDAADVRRQVLAAFAGKEVTIDQLEAFVIAETPYRETHLRSLVLKPMEKAGELRVDPSTRGKGLTYPKGSNI